MRDILYRFAKAMFAMLNIGIRYSSYVHLKGSHRNIIPVNMRVTHSPPLRTAYRPIMALRIAYRNFLASRTAYRLTTKQPFLAFPFT